MNGYIKGRPDSSWWETQINAGIAYRKKYAKQEKWDLWRKYYRGDWKTGVLPSALFFRMLRTVVPRVYFRNPSVSVIARKPGMLNWAFAQVLERVDNKLIRQMKMKKSFKSIVQDGFLFGTGIGKLGFGAEFTPTPDPVYTQGPTTSGGHRLEYNSLVQPQMPWFMRVPTGNFIVPAGTIVYEDSRWCAELIRRPVDDLREDSRFKHVKDIKASRTMNVGNIGSVSRQYKFRQPIDMVDMYEIRDKKTGMVIVIAPHSTDKVLLFEEDEMQMNGETPYFDVVFNEDDEIFWGVPDSVHLEPEQLEANEVRTLMMKHWRISIIKWLYQKGKIFPTEIDKLLSGDVGAAVELTGDVNQDIRQVEASEIPNSLFQAEQNINDSVRENLGFSRNEFGEFNPANARTTKFEAQVVKAASEIRVDERRDIMADKLVDVIKQIHEVIFRQWTDIEIIDIVGPAGVPLWIQYQPEMLRSGRYEVNVDPDSAVPQTRDVREAKADRVYERLKVNPLIDPLSLTRYYLHEMHGVQFDDMMRGLPQGAGGPQQPLRVEQYSDILQRVGQRAPQALPQPGDQNG